MDVRVGLWRKLSTKELMLLNSGVGEDSWESLGLQGDLISPILNKISPEYSLQGQMLKLKLQYFDHMIQKTVDPDAEKDWRQEEREWKRKRWVNAITYSIWVSSRSWWWTDKPGVLQSIGSQRVGHDWAIEQHIFQNSYFHLKSLIFFLTTDISFWFPWSDRLTEFIFEPNSQVRKVIVCLLFLKAELLPH